VGSNPSRRVSGLSFLTENLKPFSPRSSLVSGKAIEKIIPKPPALEAGDTSSDWGTISP